MNGGHSMLPRVLPWAICVVLLLVVGCGDPQLPANSHVSPTASADVAEEKANARSESTTTVDEDALPGGPPEEDHAPAAEVQHVSSSPPTSARELVQIRAQHDHTTWKDEVESQRYERTFVALWDQLIFQDDKYACDASVSVRRASVRTVVAEREDGLGNYRQSVLG